MKGAEAELKLLLSAYVEALTAEAREVEFERLELFLKENAARSVEHGHRLVRVAEDWLVDARLEERLAPGRKEGHARSLKLLLYALQGIDPEGNDQRQSRHENFDLREERKRIEEQEVAKTDQIKKLVESKLREDFLAADDFFYATGPSREDSLRYKEVKAQFVRQWFIDRRNNSPGAKMPDIDQCASIAATSNAVQVVARAGSGKTATLVDRAEFLIEHCKVRPDTILLLAFNNKAAKEIRERLQEILQTEVGSLNLPHVETFHALAYALVHPERILVDGAGEQSGLHSQTVQEVIDDHLSTEPYRSQIRDVMLAYFKEDWDTIIEGGFHQDQQTYLNFRRSLQRQSLKGEPLKSRGEKLIADFLFEHGVPYEYERSHNWGGRNYKPDFTLPRSLGGGLVIEYFGMNGDPDYDDMSSEKRAYWKNKKGDGWDFLEFSPSDIGRYGAEEFKKLLGECLTELGFQFKKLSDDEIWARSKRRAIDHFTSVVKSFIGRCRKSGLSSDQLDEKIANWISPSTAITAFLQISRVIYRAYLHRLSSTGDDDFDGLMQKAALNVRAGGTYFKNARGEGDLRKLKFVSIDEYQDFSKSFFDLTEAARAAAGRLQLFCVGDDWQAINSFAGSDLIFFKEFERYFGSVEQLHLRKNYRSSRKIVEAGNQLMRGRGLEGLPASDQHGDIVLADTSLFAPNLHETEAFPRNPLVAAVLRIVRATIAEGDNLILLSRTKTFDGMSVETLLTRIRSKLPQDMTDLVSASTVHSFKGKQAAVAVILDANAWAYPLIHPHWVFTEILGSNIEEIVEDERRLFYVAVTRAQKKLFIITDGSRASPFLGQLQNTQPLHWTSIEASSLNPRRISVEISNSPRRANNGTLHIKDDLRASGYKWHAQKKVWWKTFSRTDFTEDQIRGELWAVRADGILVVIDLGSAADGLIKYDVNNGKWMNVPVAP